MNADVFEPITLSWGKIVTTKQEFIGALAFCLAFDKLDSKDAELAQNLGLKEDIAIKSEEIKKAKADRAATAYQKD